MTAIATSSDTGTLATTREPSQNPFAMALRSRRVIISGGILVFVVIACVVTLPWTLGGVQSGGSSVAVPRYSNQIDHHSRLMPFEKHDPNGTARLDTDNVLRDTRPESWFGYDRLGRSIFVRCLLGGTISLAVGFAAATISVVLGAAVGLVAGYRGGWIDSVLMRIVDVMYGLPYILLVILFKIALESPLSQLFGSADKPNVLVANLVVLFLAIGLVSWLTMARVIRGQVLSLRSQPFIEACRAMGLPEMRIFMRHILPNLIGPIIVYATLTVPSAILQESFLSFLGIGVNAPLPTWGSLASEAVQSLSPVKIYWWLLLFPCILLVITLLCLNFLGDGLRDVFDPKKEAAKI